MLDSKKEKIFTTHFDIENDRELLNIICLIPKDILNQGNYSFDVAIFQKGVTVFEYLEDICKFSVLDVGSELYYQADDEIGSVRVPCDWSIYEK